MASLAGSRAAVPGPPTPSVELSTPAALVDTLTRIGLPPRRPVLVSVGGAGGMTPEHLDALSRLLSEHLLAVLSRHHAVVVDGGTHSGVMKVMGEVVAQAGADVPLLGVAARGTVRVPGRPLAREDAADLDPNHTVVLLVPGDEWGDESPWIATVADALCGRAAPSVTIVVNGGEITYADVRHSVDAGRPVVVVDGTGRTADALAAAVRGEVDADPRAIDLVGSGLVHAVTIDDGRRAAALVEGLLAPAP